MLVIEAPFTSTSVVWHSGKKMPELQVHISNLYNLYNAHPPAIICFWVLGKGLSYFHTLLQVVDSIKTWFDLGKGHWGKNVKDGGLTPTSVHTTCIHTYTHT